MGSREPPRRALAGSRPAASRPWIAHAVDWALEAPPGTRGKPPSGFWCLTHEAGGAAHGLRALAARGDQALDRGAGVVDPGRAAAAGEVEAAVGIGLARQPAPGRAHRPRPRRAPASSSRSAIGCSASSRRSFSTSAATCSFCVCTEVYSPIAIEIAPATSPATPVRMMTSRATPPPPTPAISAMFVTSPSIAPKTAARSQPPETSAWL